MGDKAKERQKGRLPPANGGSWNGKAKECREGRLPSANGGSWNGKAKECREGRLPSRNSGSSWNGYIAGRFQEGGQLCLGLGFACLLFHFLGIGCPIWWLTGISCAGCGMTRAVCSALRLQFAQAFYYHPLFWMMPICALLFLVWEKIPGKMRVGIASLIAACFAGVYLVRLCDSHHPVVSVEWETGMIARTLGAVEQIFQ